jgi:hypothetical protein
MNFIHALSRIQKNQISPKSGKSQLAIGSSKLNNRHEFGQRLLPRVMLGLYCNHRHDILVLFREYQNKETGY